VLAFVGERTAKQQREQPTNQATMTSIFASSQTHKRSMANMPLTATTSAGITTVKRRRGAPVELDDAGEELSMETRARRKRELVRLRGENQRLRDDRYEFLSKIQELEQQLETSTRAVGSTTLVSENAFLATEISEHRRVMSQLLDLGAHGVPSGVDTEHLYLEGADTAQTYVLGLLSQSQEKWERARTPADLAEAAGVDNLLVTYSFCDELFEAHKGIPRVNLRVDFEVPNVTADHAAAVVLRALSDQDHHHAIFSNQHVDVQEVDEDKMPDSTVRAIRYRWNADPRLAAGVASGVGGNGADTKGKKKKRKTGAAGTAAAAAAAVAAEDEAKTAKPKFAVFVSKRERRELAKSTLAVPRKLRRSGAKQEPDEFGNVTATVISMKSTNLYMPEEQTDSEGAVRLGAVAVKGAVIWDEEDYGALPEAEDDDDDNDGIKQTGRIVRVCVVQSLPRELSAFWTQHVTASNLVNAKGTLTKAFAGTIKATAKAVAQALRSPYTPPRVKACPSSVVACASSSADLAKGGDETPTCSA
jgi:hypothetical protein